MSISEKEIVQENLLQKINAISDLERLDPYPNYLAHGDYGTRIERACRFIPPKYHAFARALFANVIYVPSIILDEAWRYHLRQLRRLYKLDRNNILSNALLLGEDADLIRRFVYSNNIKGRLDLDRQPRSPRTGDLTKDILLLKLLQGGFDSSQALQELASSLQEEMGRFVKRRYWILLVDNSLSGASLCSELEKIRTLTEVVNLDAEIIVLVQIITSDAMRAIDGIKGKHDSKIIGAICLDERFKINSDKCTLFNDPETLRGARDLCEWFAVEILSKDEDYSATRDLTKDNLRYGFKSSGLTLVTPNCPSNSVPPIWYHKPNVYEGPYPRVESRTSQVRSVDSLVARALVAV